jgi:hypothetical protein
VNAVPHRQIHRFQGHDSYRRSNLFEKRRALMREWAPFGQICSKQREELRRGRVGMTVAP